MSEFLEKVLTVLSKSVSIISNALTYSLKKVRIRKQIKGIQEKKITMQRNLGELIYNLQMGGTVDISECVPICDRITEYGAKISALQAEEKRMEEEKFTPKEEKCPQLQSEDTSLCTDITEDFDLTSE